MDEDRLFQHTTTLDQGANFLATRDGHLALLTPHDAVAGDWLRRHVGEEATWFGPTLAVEMNYFPNPRRGDHLGGFFIRAGRSSELTLHDRSAAVLAL